MQGIVSQPHLYRSVARQACSTRILEKCAGDSCHEAETLEPERADIAKAILMIHPKPCFQDHRKKYGTHHWEQFKDHVFLKSVCMATVVTGASASQKRNVQKSNQEKKHQLPRSSAGQPVCTTCSQCCVNADGHALILETDASFLDVCAETPKTETR